MIQNTGDSKHQISNIDAKGHNEKLTALHSS